MIFQLFVVLDLTAQTQMGSPDMALQTTCKACLNVVVCASSAKSAGAQAVTSVEAKCTCVTPRIDWNICIIHTITNDEHMLQVMMKQNLLMDVNLACAKDSFRLLFVKGPVTLENSTLNKVRSKHCLGSRAGGSRCEFLFLGL